MSEPRESEGNEEKTTRQWSANQEEAGNEIWEKWEAHKSAGGEDEGM